MNRPDPGRRRAAGEDGAYLVLFALLVVALLSMVALVLDIAALRQDRRGDRLAADLAATAGAGTLNTADPASAGAACTAAWDYFMANRPDAVGTVTPPPCTSTFATVCAGTTARHAVGTAGPYTVEITNPVPDGDFLLRAQAGATTIDQPAGPGDGPPCERLGVRVLRTRTFRFAAIAGLAGSATDVHSVARATVAASGTTAPSIVSLRAGGCAGLSVTGDATVAVGGVRPGLVVADADGAGCGAGSYVLAPGAGRIQALAVGATPGSIRSFALAAGNSVAAYDPGAVPTGLDPAPVPGLRPFGRGDADARYHCTDPTCPPGSDPVSDAQSFAALPLAPPPVLTGCTVPVGVSLLVPAGDWRIPCGAGFTVDGSLTFEGGRIAFDGPLTVGPTGCVAVGDGSCGMPVAGTSAFIVTGGPLAKDPAGRAYLRSTTVVLPAGGRLDLPAGTGTGALVWTAPATGPFEDLLVWGEAAGRHVLGGQPTFELDGIVFLPGADPLELQTVGSQPVVTAQLLAGRIEVSGSGTWRIDADPGRALPDRVRTVSLIR